MRGRVSFRHLLPSLIIAAGVLLGCLAQRAVALGKPQTVQACIIAYPRRQVGKATGVMRCAHVDTPCTPQSLQHPYSVDASKIVCVMGYGIAGIIVAVCAIIALIHFW